MARASTVAAPDSAAPDSAAAPSDPNAANQAIENDAGSAGAEVEPAPDLDEDGPTPLGSGTVGQPHHEQVFPDTLSRAMPPVQFSIAGGALPPGLVLGGGGLITGTPTEAGEYRVQIQGHDANNEPHIGDYSVTVLDAEPPAE